MTTTFSLLAAPTASPMVVLNLGMAVLLAMVVGVRGVEERGSWQCVRFVGGEGSFVVCGGCGEVKWVGLTCVRDLPWRLCPRRASLALFAFWQWTGDLFFLERILSQRAWS